MATGVQVAVDAPKGSGGSRRRPCARLAVARSSSDDRQPAMHVCRVCAGGLDVDGAAVSLFTESDARQTLAATDETAELLEDLQFTLNEGACMDAATTGNPVLVADLHRASDPGTRSLTTAY